MGIDIETGLRRTGGNRTLYIDLLKDFATDHGNDHRVIVQALVGNDIELAHRTAHTLKGVAGGLGALSLYESAQKVETELRDGQSEAFEPLMETLARDLREVVEDLRKKMMSPAPIDLKNKSALPLDTEQMMALINTLQGLAGEMDPDAEEIAEEISRLLHLHDSVHGKLGDRLVQQTIDLDFEKALETLAELREAFGNTNS